jgi:hypothetical protein
LRAGVVGEELDDVIALQRLRRLAIFLGGRVECRELRRRRAMRADPKRAVVVAEAVKLGFH